MTGQEILIVDDTPDSLQFLTRILAERGYRVRPASSGYLALRSVAAKVPDLILLDIKMPDMDGYEVCRRLKSDEQSRQVPVIFISALEETSDKVKGFNAGGVDYITKPFQPEEVLARVRIHLDLRRLQVQLERAYKDMEDQVRQRTVELEEANAALRKSERNLSIRNQIAEIFLTTPNQVYEKVLQIVLEALDSRQGLFGYIDEHGDLLCTAMTRDDRDRRQFSGRDIAFSQEIWEGIWGQALVEKKTLCLNESFQVPDGHTPILRTLDVPIIHQGEGIGNLLVGNKATDYDEQDIQLLESIANYMAPVLSARLQRDRLEDERRRAEEERSRLLVQIQEQAQRVQQIVDTVPEGMLLLDDGGQVILANPLGEKDLLTLANATVGDMITFLGDCSVAELMASAQTGKGLWHDTTMAERDFQIITRPIETSPTLGGWVVVIRDVTLQREIERRVQQQERLAAVGQLAAGIAHDFNNIMATIVLYAQMTARMGGLPPRVQERMETINQQANHASRLIRQILDFSRRSVFERFPLDLLSFFKEQVQLLKRTLPENIEVKLSYGSDEYASNADPTRIQQMVTNLAVNARDAMPEGGELCIELERVRIEPHQAILLPEMEVGEWIQITISDTGTGIPPGTLPHIFDPFFTTKEPGQGSGLGLAQVHGIVGSHEGHITVDSEMDEGTTFTIYLPTLPQHPRDSATPATISPVRGQGETILIVEDNAAARGALVESLEQLNYRVVEAVNGREALTILEQRGDEIALVLSDAVMPEMGGIALLRNLRQQGLTVPMVMLTGHPMEEELQSLQAQGLSSWILKPPRLEQLAQVINRALKKR